MTIGVENSGTISEELLMPSWLFHRFASPASLGRWPHYSDEGAGGVMDGSDDAHDPSARFAGTSPRLTRGGILVESSGQRGPGRKSSASVRPSRSRSMPAQAIMAPLSVQSFIGGATRRAPYRAATSSRRPRRERVAASP